LAGSTGFAASREITSGYPKPLQGFIL